MRPGGGRNRLAGWLALALLLAPGALAAQTPAQIEGRVEEPDGTPLAGVQVSATGPSGSFTATTGANGGFFLRLPPGVYDLVFEFQGMTTVTQRGVPAQVGRSTPLTITMELPAEEEQVDVRAGVERSVRGLTDRCEDLPPSAAAGDTAEGAYRPICFLGMAAYAYNAPPDLRHLEQEEILFRLDPTRTPLEAKEDVEGLGLRGTVEAASVPWSRCMEAELVETTIGPVLGARELGLPEDAPRLRITPLHDDPVRRIGLHPNDWRWTVEGTRPGRTQLALRLYAVGVRRDSPLGSPECGARHAEEPSPGRRVRTLQRRITIDVSPVERVEALPLPPWLWSLALALGGLARAWWLRRNSRPVLEPGAES